jgi:hypothetical protein
MLTVFIVPAAYLLAHGREDMSPEPPAPLPSAATVAS